MICTCNNAERAIARLIFSPGGEQIVAVICHEYFRNCRRHADRLLLMDDVRGECLGERLRARHLSLCNNGMDSPLRQN
jgi:hypothetical protein